MMTKLYLLSKVLHRVSLYFTSLLIVFMSLTGICLKYPQANLFHLDMGLIRSLHSNFSLYFVLALFIMMITGLIMYIYPELRKHKTN
jgi:uncharacterized iron-regulated membrane protein